MSAVSQFRQRVQAMRDSAEDERGYERDRMEEVKADVFRRRAEARRTKADAAAAERASHREEAEEAEAARREAEMDEAQRTFQMALSGKLDSKPKKKVRQNPILSLAGLELGLALSQPKPQPLTLALGLTLTLSEPRPLS